MVNIEDSILKKRVERQHAGEEWWVVVYLAREVDS